jgi:hypothetical protein
MLSAYFDDSGTHDQSDIVVVAGVFGTEWQLMSLERLWRKHLQRPLDGKKRSLRRFHMTDCHDSRGEFLGWTRTETDYFCHQLRSTIIDSHVAGYGIACARKDWDALVSGDLRAILGDPEGLCIRNVFVKCLGYLQAQYFDPHVTFVFDNRPSTTARDAKVVFDAFQKWVREPRLTGIALLSSYDALPLQAADMIAWELYQHANDILVQGLKVPARKELLHLTSNMDFNAQIAQRDSIKRIIDHWSKENPDELKKIADHFTFFDPDSPDYSYLSGKRPP